MNSTKLTPQQLGDLKREFASVMIGDMTPKELFEFAVHRVLCDVATMKQDELKEHKQKIWILTQNGNLSYQMVR